MFTPLRRPLLDAQAARAAIVRLAADCEAALQTAATADELGLTKVAPGLRKLAELHSHHAFRWATRLQEFYADPAPPHSINRRGGETAVSGAAPLEGPAL